MWKRFGNNLDILLSNIKPIFLGAKMKMEKFDKTRKIPILPDGFVKRIERDLNKVIESIPDFFANKYGELQEVWNYPNGFEFLVGWCIGICEGSYLQAYQQMYQGTPTVEQVAAIHKIIARRKSHIEQGVSAFLEENAKI